MSNTQQRHAHDAQPGGQPDAPIHGFYLACILPARRLPDSLGVRICGSMVLVYFVIAAAISWGLHRTVKSPTFAAVLSVLVSLPIFVLLRQPHFGWFDTTFWENLIVCTFIAAAATIVVGVYVRRLRPTVNDTAKDT